MMKQNHFKPSFDQIGWETWLSLFGCYIRTFLPRFFLWLFLACIPLFLFQVIAGEEGLSSKAISNFTVLYVGVLGLLVSARACNADFHADVSMSY